MSDNIRLSTTIANKYTRIHNVDLFCQENNINIDDFKTLLVQKLGVNSNVKYGSDNSIIVKGLFIEKFINYRAKQIVDEINR